MNENPKLLYVSPFPPLKSGISDYSVILVDALKSRYDITLYVDDYDLADVDKIKEFPILKHGKDSVVWDSYDYIIYNIGNNPYFHDYIYEACIEHPGMVILHDLVLYYMFIGYYQKRNCLYSRIYEQEGLELLLKIKEYVKKEKKDLLQIKGIASEFPFHKELLESGNKIMVHSQYAFDRVKQYTNKVKKINMIQQVAESFELIKKDKLYKKYGIPTDAIVITSFGIVAETKLNHIACEVVRNIAKEKKVCYVMVGEGEYVNCYVDNKHIFKTGYVDMDEFDSFIVHSDIVLNLRHPSMGETSAALIKILQMGKACIINDEGWFAEIPADCAVKLPIDNIKEDLEQKLTLLIDDVQRRKQIEQNAEQYIKAEYSTKKIIDDIERFLFASIENK